MFKRLRTKLTDILHTLTEPEQGCSAPTPGVSVLKKAREPAPVMVYFERDRNQRLIERVQELLTSRNIVFRSLDVSGDAATLAFITREAKCEDDDLPIVFVAGAPVGGYNELVDWDVSGKLKTSVFGDGGRP